MTIPKRWNLKRANWTQFCKNLPSLEIDTTVDATVNTITSNIITTAREAIPQTTNRQTKRSVPWWNDEVENAVRRKKRALNIFKRFPTRDNMINFKRLRAKARRVILNSKRSSWESYVSELNPQTPPAEVWRKIRAIVGRRTPPRPILLLVDNQLKNDQQTVANILAEHFYSTSSTNNYSQEFRQVKESLETPLNFIETEPMTYNSPFTMVELEAALSELKESAPGVDNIPYEMIRRLPMPQKLSILTLFNKIWQEGLYPEKWREAIIIPLLKEGKDPNDPKSYRPISLTCCMSKILEKMVNARLIWYIETHRLISNLQMGFRKFRSTADQLVRLEQEIQISFADRNHVVAIFFDLEKAYDMTWRYGVLKKLHEWGFRGNLPNFIGSFMSDRFFRVRIGDTFSDLFCLENGIPQGSTLSVTLFAIAVDDMMSRIDPDIKSCLYVDDLVIYLSTKCMARMEGKLQEAINTIVENAESKGFRFSDKKTHCMHFCRLRSPHDDPHLVIKGREIELVSQTKFLGVTFDRKLTWKDHITDLARKCKKSLNIMKCLANINWGADRDILLKLYTATIQSKMDYGCTVYSSARKSHLKVLDIIQSTGLRLATGAFRTSPTLSLQCDSSVPPLHLRRRHLLLNYGVKIWAQPNHPNHDLLFSQNYDLFEGRPSITRPVGLRIKELLDEVGEVLPQAFPLGFRETPPWSITGTSIHIQNAHKSDTSPLLLLANFRETVGKYPNSTIIYTDGSKTNRGVGSAFTCVGEQHSWTLHPWASIYTAELYAIWQALLYAEFQEANQFLICSDSLSALKEISNSFSFDPLVQRIHDLLHNLSTKRKNITFIWSPGHIGIAGNEMADQAAKHAANGGIPEDIPIRPDDIKSSFKNKITLMWQREWEENENKLKEIKPSVQPWKLPHNLTRREKVVLTRLRIGHTRLTSAYLLLGRRQPNCPSCMTSLTVKHILLECDDFRDVRNLLNISNNLPECLENSGNSVVRLMAFLKTTRLFNKL